MNNSNRSLSVIVPVGPGDHVWRPLLLDLKFLGTSDEVIFSATEEPPEDWEDRRSGIAARLTWLTGSKGRAPQLNRAAADAKGQWLWFLHADTRVPRRTQAALVSFLGRPPIGRGSQAPEPAPVPTPEEDSLYFFDLRFQGDGPALVQLNEWGADLRARYLGLPFGDQGFLLSRALFFDLGQFPEAVSVGEDHHFVWRARQAGCSIVPMGAPIITSARKYRAKGWLPTTARHLFLTAQQAAPEVPRFLKSYWRQAISVGRSRDLER